MERREHGGSEAWARPRRRWRRWLVLPALVAAVWFAPHVAVHSSLRDQPLAWITAGLDGRLASRAAAWTWWGGIEYRDVVLTDRAGRAVAAARRVNLDRGLLALALEPRALGTVRITGPEVIVEVRRGGSSVEDMLAPWLAGLDTATTVRCDLEVVDGVVHGVDLVSGDSWRITDILAAASWGGVADEAGWTVSGIVVHSGQAPRDLATAFGPPPPGGAADAPRPTGRLERTTVAAGATAILAQAGGVSVSAPPRATTGDLAVTGNRVPLGVSRLFATRFDQPWHATGSADVRLALRVPAGGGAADGIGIRGAVSAAPLAVVSGRGVGDMLRLERCDIPLDIVVGDGQIVIRDLKATAPLLVAEASGRIGIPTGGMWEWADTLVRDDFAVAVDIDLAAAARAVPGGLEVRPDVRVTGGQLQLAASGHAAGADRLLEVRATARDLAAVQGERPLRWSEPFTGWFRGRLEPGRGGRLRIDEARLASPAVELVARGGRDELAVEWTADLGGLVNEVGEILDLGGVTAGGVSRGRIDVTSPTEPAAAARATAASRLRLAAGVEHLVLAVPGRPEWRDAELTVTAEGTGAAVIGGVIVDTGTMTVTAGGDILEARLAGGALVDPRGWAAWLTGQPTGARLVTPAPAATEGLHVETVVSGGLAAWQRRLGAATGIGTGPPTVTNGTLRAAATLVGEAAGWRVSRSAAEVEQLEVDVAGRRITEPRLVASAAGGWRPGGPVEITAAELLTATLSLRTGGLTVGRAAAAADGLLGQLRGRGQWQADLGRLGGWLAEPGVAPRYELTGRTWGTVDLVETPVGQNLLVEATANQMTLGETTPDGPLRVVWAEPQATLLVDVTRPTAAGGAGSLSINRLALSSATMAVAAAGTLSELSSRRMIDVGGTLAIDWDRLSALVVPWTGGRVRLTGGGPRPFQFRMPLRPTAPLVTAAAVPLPAGWLAAQGNRSRADDTAVLPVEVGPDPAATGRLRTVVLDASTGWNAADLDGLPLDAGELPLRLFEGQMVFGPFDLAAAGGRLRGGPWLRLEPGPVELIVPPGRVVDRVALSSAICQRWISWVSPLLGRATRTTGQVTVDMAGARLPVADPWGGEVACQVVFENLEVTPGPHVQPLADLLVRLQSVIDPRFAFGDKAVLLRVRPEPVRLHLAGGRVWQEGLVMDMGQMVVRTAGSVGADGSLAMDVELALRGDLVGATPVVSRLLRTPLVVPLKGTVEQPRFDAAAIDTILARIIDNTAEAVIRDGLGRGLDQLEIIFGNPPVPAAPPAR